MITPLPQYQGEVQYLQAILAAIQVGTPPSGAAGGDLSGTYPNPGVEHAPAGGLTGTTIAPGVVTSSLTTFGTGYTLSGTAGQTYTFPSTSATIARTNGAQTFTGDQTFDHIYCNFVGSNATGASTRLDFNGFGWMSLAANGVFQAILDGTTWNGYGPYSLGSTLNVDGVTTFGSRANFKSYTVGTLPAATLAGGLVYVSNAAVAPCLAFTNGTDWKRCDNAATTVI